ncbi:DUF3768 domain-containing protein [Albimonas sp. CAU 1670]|uniref:DUF3768 domain-containing protein n=1 Tax=Albimonas sp. CAU 1670 TaxID=3032599 RepID=UPI0023D9FE85|nr:DUF3768 domain-containing protein [Albimonas sp. CAU 1670]MDF2232407.1 DUF3768 domain-containing protein [Albimonas sp. CAU 1670]
MSAAKGPHLPDLEQNKNIESEDAKRLRVRELNDALRKRCVGGQVLATRGIGMLPAPLVARIFEAVGAFNDFTEDNDPWGEHDCAAIEVDGIRVIWKIDYYDRTMTAGSPDPSDPLLTLRVLTVMRAEEY